MRSHQDNAVGRYVTAFGLSVAITSVVNGALLVLEETSEAAYVWMTAATGDHWITQGLIIVGLFVVLGIGLAFAGRGRKPAIGGGTLAAIVVFGTAAGALIITGFYL
jgi:hypothetical protein